MIDLDSADAEARSLIDFADGFADAGHPETARRSRVVARLALELAEELRAERSARRAMQANYERCLNVLVERGTK